MSFAIVTALFVCGCGGIDPPVDSVANSARSLETSPAYAAESDKDGRSQRNDNQTENHLRLEQEFRRSTPPSDYTGATDSFSSQEFSDEFYRSSKAFSGKYRGKVLEVMGTVAAIGQTMGGEAVLRISGPNGRRVIRCVTRTQDDGLRDTTGQTVRVRGVTCDAPVPALIHCEVVEISGKPRNPTDANVPDSQIDVPERPDFVVTAEAYDRELIGDPDATKKKYANKYVEISGRIARISHAGSGEVFYRLSAELDNPSIGPQCYLRYGSPWFCARPGQYVKMRGRCMSSNTSLVSCEVLFVDGIGNARCTAESLAAQFESEQAKFRQNYDLRQLIIDGTILRKESIVQDRPVRASLVTSRKTRIQIEFDESETAIVESISANDAVTILGWCKIPESADELQLLDCLFWRGEK